MKQNIPSRSIGISLTAGLLVLFGLAEVVTGFTHAFLGITTSSKPVFTFFGVLLGLFYVAAGILILSMHKWAANIAIMLLIADILGRIALVVTGLFPTDSAKNTFSIIAGTLIAAIFAGYIALRRKSFQ